ncbi:MAG: hypothetical protein JSS24_01865 [Proteobacteria bacterium]|nr:hypothetical protein [Pseudomonadota bacterium]
MQRVNACMLCGRPRKFFTRSLAGSEPPGSSTVRRYRSGASPASGSAALNCEKKSSAITLSHM